MSVRRKQGKLREVSRDAFGGILGLVCSWFLRCASSSWNWTSTVGDKFHTIACYWAMISNHPNWFWVEIPVSVVLLYQIVNLIVWYEVDGLCKEILPMFVILQFRLQNDPINFKSKKNGNTCNMLNVIHITIVMWIISHQ